MWPDNEDRWSGEINQGRFSKGEQIDAISSVMDLYEKNLLSKTTTLETIAVIISN